MESDTNIRVDREGRWWNGDALLIHEGILTYFKANLHRAVHGRYFILNRFGEKIEIGWLQSVDGFPLFALRASVDCGQIHLALDSGVSVTIPLQNLRVDADNLVWTLAPPHANALDRSPASVVQEQPIPVRLGPAAMIAIADDLDEDDGGHWRIADVPLKQETSPYPGSDG